MTNFPIQDSDEKLKKRQMKIEERKRKVVPLQLENKDRVEGYPKGPLDLLDAN